MIEIILDVNKNEVLLYLSYNIIYVKEINFYILFKKNTINVK
jgi:hypothetical protein